MKDEAAVFVPVADAVVEEFEEFEWIGIGDEWETECPILRGLEATNGAVRVGRGIVADPIVAELKGEAGVVAVEFVEWSDEFDADVWDSGGESRSAESFCCNRSMSGSE